MVQSGGERATDLQRKAHALYGKSRLTPLERRLKNEPPSNAASEDGTGAVIHVDMTDLIVGDLTTTTYLEDILDTGLQRLLAVKVKKAYSVLRPGRVLILTADVLAPLLSLTFVAPLAVLAPLLSFTCAAPSPYTSPFCLAWVDHGDHG